jgi:hypothetical protein
MTLELTAEEARELRETVESHLRGLMQEIVHTDQRRVRELLRTSYGRLDGLLQRLDGLCREETAQAHA